jgi:hypothetical protein
MDAGIDTKRGVRELQSALDKLAESLPANEAAVFGAITDVLTLVVEAIRVRWTAFGDLEMSDPVESPGRLKAIYVAADSEYFRQQTDRLGEELAKLWGDAGSLHGGDIATKEDILDRILAVANPPTRAALVELRRASAEWAKARERGRRHREQAIAEIGPVLTPSQVVTKLGVTSVTVKNWRQKGRLLGIKFDNHQFLYPAYQFASSPAEGAEGILLFFPKVLEALPFGSSWAKAQFFVAPSPALMGRAPIDVVRQLSDPDTRDLRPEERDALRERLLLVASHAGEMGT